MSILNNIYGANNSPFDNFVRSNYVPQTPQNRLQMAYQQAMAKRTPEWARTVSDMMPSIAEIVAYGTTKGAFNQGTIANSLEREKQRRTAYNQMMRENEDKQVNDYVQLAKEQLGMDMAQDDRERAKEEAQIQRDIERENRIEAQNRWLADQEMKKQQIEQAQKNWQSQFDANQENIKNQLALDKEKLEWEKTKANNQANAKSNEDIFKQYQESMANIENAKAKIGKLAQAKQLNRETPNSSIGNVFKLGANPFSKIPSNDRMSPLYQALTTETDAKKAEMELLKYGISKDMSPDDLDRNVDRLIADSRNEIIKEYAKLGYKIQQDDETGAVRVVDTKGNIIEEF